MTRAAGPPAPYYLRQRIETTLRTIIERDGAPPTAEVLARRAGVSRSLADAALRRLDR